MIDRIGRAALAAIFCAVVSGCAYVHVDEDGVKHIVGFLLLSMPAATTDQPAADGFRTRSIGLTLHRFETGGALTLGIQESSITAFRDNACVVVSDLHWTPARAAAHVPATH